MLQDRLVTFTCISMMLIINFIQWTILLSITQAVNAAQQSCDAGWIAGTESCYKMVQSPPKQWSDAKTACEAMNAHLVIVMTVEENNFLIAEIKKLNTGFIEQFWMDGTDVTTEGAWLWESTGDGFEITDWAPGEPNQNAGNEDCLSFFVFLDDHWNDEHCNTQQSYICEKEFPVGPVVG